MEQNYKQKYLKYKAKYQQSKQQDGGVYINTDKLINNLKVSISFLYNNKDEIDRINNMLSTYNNMMIEKTNTNISFLMDEIIQIRKYILSNLNIASRVLINTLYIDNGATFYIKKKYIREEIDKIFIFFRKISQDIECEVNSMKEEINNIYDIINKFHKRFELSGYNPYMIHNCIYLPILFLLSDKCLKNITSYDGISNFITSIISNLYNLEKPYNIKYQIIDKFHTSLFSDINKKQETEDKQIYINMNIDFFRLYMLKLINKVSGDEIIYNSNINDIITKSYSILNRSSYSLGPSDQLMTDQIGGDEDCITMCLCLLCASCIRNCRCDCSMRECCPEKKQPSSLVFVQPPSSLQVYGQQQMVGSPQQQMFGPPQQQMFGPPQQQMFGSPQQQMVGPPQQQMYRPPQQQMVGPPQQQMYRPPLNNSNIQYKPK